MRYPVGLDDEAVAAQAQRGLEGCVDVLDGGVGAQDRVLDPCGKGGSVYFFRSL